MTKIGYKQTKEHKKKISNSLKGEKNPFYSRKHSEQTKKRISEAKKGSTPWNKGLTNIYSNSTVQKMSEHALKRFKNKEDHPSWKGGVKKSNIPLYDTYAHQIDYCESVRRSPKNKDFLEIACTYCGKFFMPSTKEVQNRISALIGREGSRGELRVYCSDGCKKACPIFRKKEWPEGFKPATSREVQAELRQMVLERDDWTCQKCEETDAELHCHHITGVVQNPIESADIDNCITFCKNCHKWAHQQEGCRYHDLKCQEEE